MRNFLVTIEIDNVITNRIVKAEDDKVALIKAREELEEEKWKQNLKMGILTYVMVEALFMKKVRYNAWQDQIWLN